MWTTNQRLTEALEQARLAKSAAQEVSQRVEKQLAAALSENSCKQKRIEDLQLASQQLPTYKGAAKAHEQAQNKLRKALDAERQAKKQLDQSLELLQTKNAAVQRRAQTAAHQLRDVRMELDRAKDTARRQLETERARSLDAEQAKAKLNHTVARLQDENSVLKKSLDAQKIHLQELEEARSKLLLLIQEEQQKQKQQQQQQQEQEQQQQQQRQEEEEKEKEELEEEKPTAPTHPLLAHLNSDNNKALAISYRSYRFRSGGGGVATGTVSGLPLLSGVSKRRHWPVFPALSLSSAAAHNTPLLIIDDQNKADHAEGALPLSKTLRTCFDMKHALTPPPSL